MIEPQEKLRLVKKNDRCKASTRERRRYLGSIKVVLRAAAVFERQNKISAICACSSSCTMLVNLFRRKYHYESL